MRSEINGQMFLALCRKGIGAGNEVISDPASTGEWDALVRLSAEQNLMPLIMDTAVRVMKGSGFRTGQMKEARDKALALSIRQIVQSNEFLTLLKHAQGQGLDPIVIKGIICRQLYPVPCLRPSVDEDILVPPGEMERYHTFLLGEGLFADKPHLSADERKLAYELSYHRQDSPTYIELHSALFDQESKVFAELNRLFAGLFERTVRVQIEDVSVRTLAPTDHLLFLILHAYKHFLYSGVGIRPMCDIGLFAEAYAAEIDWQDVRLKLTSVNAYYYAKGIFRIIELYLLPEAAFLTLIRDWMIYEVDIEALLEDSLAGGVSGASSLSRLHSSNLTLLAVEKQDSRYGNGYCAQAVRLLFPAFDYMKDKYPYLKKAPLLLPCAWVQRLVQYFLEIRSNRKNCSKTEDSAAESLRIGAERVKLLREYKFII